MSKSKTDLEILNDNIKQTKKFDHTIINEFMIQTYKLKEKYLYNEKDVKKLDYIIEYLNYQSEKLKIHKNHILSLVTTIFLPLSFITGYFGMNFKSMGNKGIGSGILSLKHSQKYLLFLSLIFIIFTMLFYNYIYNLF